MFRYFSDIQSEITLYEIMLYEGKFIWKKHIFLLDDTNVY